MGISQSLQRAITTHPRFPKVQYGADTDITVVHFELDDHEHKIWRGKVYEKFPEVKVWEDDDEETVEQKIKEKYPYLLLVRDKDVRVVRDGFCSEKCKLLIKMNKVWETTLQREITQRKSIERYFSEQQIWLILLQLAQTIQPIHEKSSTSILGNLHPTNVLINIHGQLMVIGDVSLPGEKNHFAMFKQFKAKRSFVSPELIGFLTKKSYKEYPNYPSCVDPQKVEAYSLGLCLLQLCCLEDDLSSLYITETSINYINPHVSRQASSRHNYSNLINQEFFTKMMHFVSTRYSRMLSMVVKYLLEDRPEDRLSVIELWSALLSEKQGYIRAMDQAWYEEALETIEEFNDGYGQQEGYRSKDNREESYEYEEYKTTERYNSGRGHQRIGSREWESLELEKNTTDSHIQVWEKSLEKHPIEIEHKKVPKISFTYL